MNGRPKTSIDAIQFGVKADTWLREAFPARNNRVNSLLLFLHRASSEMTNQVETNVHKSLGLSWAGYKLLFVLWIEGALEPARAAEIAQMSRASASALSATFSKAGLIEKRPSKTDRRSIVLSLSPEGRKLVELAYLNSERDQVEMFSTLTEAEQEILLILLRKVIS